MEPMGTQWEPIRECGGRNGSAGPERFETPSVEPQTEPRTELWSGRARIRSVPPGQEQSGSDPVWRLDVDVPDPQSRTR